MSDVLGVLDPAAAPSLRWGIIAPGGIANKFAEAVSQFTAGQVVAVSSRDEGRARSFAERHGIPRAYAGHEALGADPEVDAVYVASPHSAHRDHAVAMARAGKHVLIEKALARNLVEVNEIFDAARGAGVFAMEAMWTRHLPHIAAVRRWIADGRIGEVVTVVADHGQSLDLGPDHRLKAPELAGGALLDLGVYPVAFVVDLLGAPTSVHAAGHRTETGVDASVALTLGYPDPVFAQASCTLKVKTPTTAVVCGTGGSSSMATSMAGRWLDFLRPARSARSLRSSTVGWPTGSSSRSPRSRGAWRTGGSRASGCAGMTRAPS